MRVSEIAFGAGPVPELMTGTDRDRQLRTIKRAIELGVNWFDTASTYGDGRSETSLGRVLKELGSPSHIHVATKVRLQESDFADLASIVRKSIESSLSRLQLSQVTLIQLHNSITKNRKDEPTSITPEDVLGVGGVADAFESIRRDGLVRFTGITGIGQPDAIESVIRSRRFETMQTPFHLLNPSAGQIVPHDFPETNYGNIIRVAAAANMGVFAIRVFAGGALLGAEPSSHTFKTKFFPLDLYQRDRLNAQLIQGETDLSVKERALEFVLTASGVTSAIIGISSADQVEELVRLAEKIRAEKIRAEKIRAGDSAPEL